MNTLEIYSLCEKPELYDQTISLIEEGFEYSDHNKYSEDFYPLINSSNHHHCYLAVVDNELVGHIGVKLSELQLGEHLIPVALIGGISIRKKFQGRGYLKTFFSYVIKKYESKIAMALLWSNLSTLYQKFSFYEAGTLYQLGNQSLPKELAGFKSSAPNKLSEQDKKRIQFIYDRTRSSESLRLIRTNKEWADIFNISSALFFLSENSYFVINKGQDLNGIIHEYASLDSKSMIDQLKDYKVWVSRNDLGALPFFQSLFLGHMRICNPALFSRLIHIWSKGQLQVHSLINEKVQFSLRESTYELEAVQFLQGIWGPAYIDELRELGPDLIITGLESV